MRIISPKTAKRILSMMGWRGMDEAIPAPKCIILGAPHTSIWDFVISWLYYRSVGGNAKVMIKKGFFKWPLAIAPEGTRRPVKRWKGGFHLIAKATGVPVFLGYFDWGTKTVGAKEEFHITDDVDADLKRIRQWYKDKGVVGKFPEKFTTGDDLD